MPALLAPSPQISPSPGTSWPVLIDVSSNQPDAIARDVFPAQPPSGVPVSAVCLTTAQRPRQIAHALGCSPPSEALDALDRCRNRKCQNERFKHDPDLGFEPFARRATIDFQLFEDAGALDECSLTQCPMEFYAAHASICVPLDTIPAVRLPRLPPGATPWDPRILDAFVNHSNGPTSTSTNTTGPATPADQLGICAPTLPLTYPCDPSTFNAYGLLNVLNGSPLRLLDPIDTAYVPKGVLTTTLRDAAAITPALPAADPQLAHPAFMLRVQPRPNESRPLALSTVNLYTMAICSAGTRSTAAEAGAQFRATLPLGSACSRDAECRMGKCSMSRGCTLGLKTNAFGYVGSHWAAVAPSSASSSSGGFAFGQSQFIVMAVVGGILAIAVAINLYAEYLQRNKAQVQATVAERVMRPVMRAVAGKTLTTVQRELTLRPADGRMLQRLETSERIEAEVAGVEGVEGLPVYAPVFRSEADGDASCPSSPNAEVSPAYFDQHQQRDQGDSGDLSELPRAFT